MVREGRVFISALGTGKPAFGSNYYVQALEVGAQVTVGSSGTTVTVAAGHGFAAGDKYMKSLDSTTYSGVSTVASVTSTSLTLDSALAVSEGDILINMGADTGSTSPNYDGAGLTIYSDMNYATAVTDNTVMCDSNGRYTYYHKGVAIWELVRTGSTLIALYKDAVSSHYTGSTPTDTKSAYIGPYTPPDLTSSSGAAGVYLDKTSATTGALGMNIFVDGNERWSLGMDAVVGNRSYFALWSDKAQVSGGAFTTGDIFGVSWGGADSNGWDPPKWIFNGAYASQSDYDTPYCYKFQMSQTLQSSGEGLYSALFLNQSASFNSGGMVIQVGGTSRLGLRINNENTGTRYAVIQTGRQDGATFRGWEFGGDILKANTQNWGIYDAENASHRLTITTTGIGIGTTTPDSPLQVHKSQNSQTTLNISNPSTGTAGTSRVYCGDASTGSAAVLERYSTGYTGDATLAGDAMVYASGASAMLHLGTAGTKRVTVLNSSAKVGIGVDPPVEALQVVGCVAANGDAVSGVASYITYTGTSDTSANSTGIGSIKFKGATSRDSTGFIKIWIGTTAYYVPVFSAITG